MKKTKVCSNSLLVSSAVCSYARCFGVADRARFTRVCEAFTIPGKSKAGKATSTKPATSARAPKADVKGKGRAVEPDRDLPRSAAANNKKRTAVASNGKGRTAPERYMQLLMGEEGSTPARLHGAAKMSTPRFALVSAPSRASIHRDARARTSSVITDGHTSLMGSAMQPKKLKTVIRNTPPRYVISSDEEDGAAYSSDDGFLLKSRDSSNTSRRSATADGEDKKPKRRKAPVGEYEIDELSRMCVPRRTRARRRSRSAALALKAERRDEDDLLTTDVTEPDVSDVHASTSNILGGLQNYGDDSTERVKDLPPPNDHGDLQADPDMPVPYSENGGWNQNQLDLPAMDALDDQQDQSMFDFTNGGGQDSDGDGEDVVVPDQLPPSEPAEKSLYERQSSPFTDNFEKSIRRVVTMENEEKLDADASIASSSHHIASQVAAGAIADAEIGDLPLMTVVHAEVQTEKAGQEDAFSEASQAAVTESTEKEAILPDFHHEINQHSPSKREDTELPPSSPPPLPPPSAAAEAISMDTDSSDEDVPVSSAARSGTWRPDLVARLASPRLRLSQSGLEEKHRRLRVTVSPAPDVEEDNFESRDRFVPVVGSRSPSLAPPEAEQTEPAVRESSLTPLDELERGDGDGQRAESPPPVRPRLESDFALAEEGHPHTLERPLLLPGSHRPISPPPVLSVAVLGDPNQFTESGQSRPPVFSRRDGSSRLFSPVQDPPQPARVSPRLESRLLSPAAQDAAVAIFASARRDLTPVGLIGAKALCSPKSLVPASTPQRAVLVPSTPGTQTARSPSPAMQRARSPSAAFLPPSPAGQINIATDTEARLRSLTPAAAASSVFQRLQSVTPNRASGSSDQARAEALLERIRSMSPAGKRAAPRSPALLSPLRAQAVPLQGTPGRSSGVAPRSPGRAFLPRSLHQMLESANAHAPKSPKRIATAARPQTPGSASARSPAAVPSGNPATPLLERIRTLRSASVASSPGKASRIPHQQVIAKEEDVEAALPNQQLGSVLQPAFDFTDATPEDHDRAGIVVEEPVRAQSPLHGNSASSAPMTTPAVPAEQNEASDFEEEAAEVARALSRSRSLSKSPGVATNKSPMLASPVRRPLMDLDDDVPLSPNVTLRRERQSASRSPASIRSKPNTPAQPLRSAAKRSFAELNFDSSPMSVAASISHKSFEALDTSSEDADDDGADGGRPSPSKQIAAAQLAQQQQQQQQGKKHHRYESLVSSSDDDDESIRSTGRLPKSMVNSSPVNGRAGDILNAITSVATSTPAKLFGSLALSITARHKPAVEVEGVAAAEARPREESASSPQLASPAPAAAESTDRSNNDGRLTTAEVQAISRTATRVELAQIRVIEGSGAIGPSDGLQLEKDAEDELDTSMAVSNVAAVGGKLFPCI